MTLPDDNKLQRMEVLRIVADGKWRTLMQLSAALGHRYLTTSLSARLRDFRKAQFGSYRVERRLVLGSDRLYEYRVLPPKEVMPNAPRTSMESGGYVVAGDASAEKHAMPAGVVRSEQKRSAATQTKLFEVQP